MRCVLASVSVSVAALAATPDTQFFLPAPGHAGYIASDGVRVPAHLRGRAGVLFDFADNPLVAVDPATGEVAPDGRLVDYRLALHVLGAVGLLDRLEIGLAIPIAAWQGGETPPASLLEGETPDDTTGAAFGDVRLVPKVRLIGRGSNGPGIALAADVVLPTGDDQRFFGTTSTSLRARALLEAMHRGWSTALNVGYRWRSPQTMGDLTVDDEIHLGLGVRGPIVRSFEAVVDLYAALGVQAPGGLDTRQLPLELLAQLRYAQSPGLVFALGGGAGLTDGYGSSRIRALASVSYQWDGPQARPPPVTAMREGAAPPSARPSGDTEDEDAHLEGSHPKGEDLVVIERHRIRLLEPIRFESGRSTILPASLPILERVASALKLRRSLRVRIEADTDSVGPDERNLALSQQRAEAVLETLVLFGVPRQRLEALGFGEARPIASNKTEAGRAKNRRIELLVVGE